MLQTRVLPCISSTGCCYVQALPALGSATECGVCVYPHRVSSYALQHKVQSDHLTPFLSMHPQAGQTHGNRADILLALNALRFSMSVLEGQSISDNTLMIYALQPVPYALRGCVSSRPASCRPCGP